MARQRTAADERGGKNYWGFHQASRLELRRADEEAERQKYFDNAKKDWKKYEKQQRHSPYARWESWWYSHEDGWWMSDWWQNRQEHWWEAAREPPAAAQEMAWNDWSTDRTPAQDKAALRIASLSPCSFQPQRWVIMALGRPVVVLGGVKQRTQCRRVFCRGSCFSGSLGATGMSLLPHLKLIYLADLIS